MALTWDGHESEEEDYEVLLARADQAWETIGQPSRPIAEVRSHLDTAMHHIRLAHLVLSA